MNAAQKSFADYEHELANTRKVLERVPTEHMAWKPHEKSWSLGSLAQHVATLAWWFEMTVKQDEFDLAGWTRPEPFTTREQILQAFDEKSQAALAALKDLQPEQLGDPWVLRAGDQVYFTMSRAAVLRIFAVSHMIHHRAQLTVYLRLLNIPIPGLYGPSADEQ